MCDSASIAAHTARMAIQGPPWNDFEVLRLAESRNTNGVPGGLDSICAFVVQNLSAIDNSKVEFDIGEEQLFNRQFRNGIL